MINIINISLCFIIVDIIISVWFFLYTFFYTTNNPIQISAKAMISIIHIIQVRLKKVMVLSDALKIINKEVV